MASFVLLTDSTLARQLGLNEVGYIGANATLATEFSLAVDMFGGTTLTVAGQIFSGSTGIYAHGSVASVITVLDAASVATSSGPALRLGEQGDKSVYNYGTIVGDDSAIAFAFSAAGLRSNLRLINGGQIIGNDATAIYGDEAAAMTISNTGQIMGQQFGIYNQASTFQVRLQSDGVVDGSLAAIALGAGNDSIHNSGVMSGDASLGGGNDYYNGQLGAQTTVFGASGGDTILGGTGDETFFGDEDGDVLKGGAGDDRMLGDNGEDILLGEDGLDLLYCGDGNDTADGGGEADIIEGGLGLDLLRGGADDDLVDAMQDDDTAFGGGGDDTVLGGDGSDLVQGGTGDDSLDGGTGADALLGGAGQDTLTGGAGADKLDGGAGDDVLTGGGATSDRFIFARGGGNDQVVDFTNNQDKLDLRVFDFVNVAAVVAVSSDSSLGLVIDLQSRGGGTILLNGFLLASLDAPDLLI